MGVGAVYADDDELELRFEDQPIEKGLTFDRDGGELATVEVDGKTSQAWVSHNSPTTPQMGWMRSMRLRVTDPAFQRGGRPVCDVEIEYMLDAWSGIEVFADTARGGVRVAQGWGGERRWKTLRFKLDDAHFDQRDTGDGSKLNSNAFDLTIYGANAPLHVRAVRIRGYDLDQNPDYQRLLRLDGYTTGEPAELMMFNPDQKPTLQYSITNLARKPLDATYRWTLRNRSGQALAQGERPTTLPGSSQTILPVTMDTTGLAYGIYSLTFELARPDDTEPIIRRESYLGIIDDQPLSKAEDGEFLYGLDLNLGPSYGSKELLQWTKHMGVDIIRHGFGPGSIDEVTEHLPTYEKYGLQVLYMHDPPKDQAQRAAQLPGVLHHLEELARRFPQIRYYELGNEPDLTFFYPGPIAHYVEDYQQMYDAIKRGNPDTVVMNGGLSFAGAEATRRSEEFIRLVDVDKLDAIAYHGHGPGAGSERHALERVRAVAEMFGKSHLPLIETESGVSARTAAQEDVQARTVVQKMVYAQSEQMPLFIWFRLLMFEEAYGNLRTAQEPRPAVLAYRHMVQRLRRHAHQAMLDLPSHLEGHVLHQRGGASRVVVLWSEQATPSHVALQIAEGPVAEAKVFDLYGNAKPLAVSAEGVAAIEVSLDPQFVTWAAPEGDRFVARAAPAILETPTLARLAAGEGNVIHATIRNPFSRTLHLHVNATLTADGTITPLTRALSVAPGDEAQISFEVSAKPTAAALQWPAAWTAFVHVHPDTDLSKVNDIPAQLPGNSGSVSPRRALPVENMIDFERLGGTMREREAAAVFAYIDSPAEQTVRMGASADWWMAWYVNGRPVYDTLAGGNGGGYAITDHTFDLPLRAGRNLLAAKVLGGSMGWKMMVGSPRDVATQTDPASIPRIVLSVIEGEAVVAREVLPIQIVMPLPPMPKGLSLDSHPEQWAQLAPDLLLDEGGLENFHEKQPDEALWWQGPQDLSGEGWLRADDEFLYLVVMVRDDRHVAGKGEFVDALHIALTDQQSGQSTAARITDGGPTPDYIKASVQRIEDGESATTVYRVRVRIGEDHGRRNLLSIEAHDIDHDHAVKQVIRWGGPTHGLIVLPPAKNGQ